MCGSSLLTRVQISDCSQYPHRLAGARTRSCTEGWSTNTRKHHGGGAQTCMRFLSTERFKHIFKELRSYQTCNRTNSLYSHQFFLSISALSDLHCNTPACPQASYWAPMSYVGSINSRFCSLQLKINSDRVTWEHEHLLPAAYGAAAELLYITLLITLKVITIKGRMNKIFSCESIKIQSIQQFETIFNKQKQ